MQNTTPTKFTYGSHPNGYDEPCKIHHLLLKDGETITFCETEGDAQDQCNYYHFFLGRDVTYMNTDEKPSKYMWSNPDGIDFILFDAATDVIVQPVSKETINKWTESIQNEDL